MEAAREILEQQHTEQLQIDEIIVASGSGQTHAGLLYGLRTRGSDLPVIGICVRRDQSTQLLRIQDHVSGLDALTSQADVVCPDDIVLVDDFLGRVMG